MENIIKGLRLTREELLVFAIGMLGAFLARGVTFFSLGYAIDDYTHTLSPPNISTGLSQGRWGAGFLFEIFNYFGIQGIFSPTLLMFISTAGFVLIGIIICRIWQINKNITLSSLVVLFITIFPYQSEIFTFKVTLTFFVFSLLLGFISIYFSGFKLKTRLLTSTMFVLAISMYQLVINYVFVTIVLSFIIEVLRSYKSNVYKYENKLWTNAYRRINLGSQLFTIVFGTFLYLLVNKLILSFLQIPMSTRGDFITLHDIQNRIFQLKTTFITVFFKAEPIFPLVPKFLLLVLLFLVLAGIIRMYTSSEKKNGDFFKIVLGVLGLLAVAMLGVFGVSVPLAVWWPMPRIIASFGVFWAGILVLGCILFGDSIKKVFFATSVLLVLSFIGINNHVYIDQLRINMKDIQKANRILVRLEMLPDFTKIKTVAVVGTKWGYGTQIETVQGDMNISAFGADWSKLNIINEVGGYDFLAASNEEIKVAEDFCKDQSILQNSEIPVRITGTLGMVCLENN